MSESPPNATAAGDRELAIKVPLLARVEGEGALEITIRDQDISALRLRIFEPPRLFEQLLVGRDWQEVLDIVARICGICPVAYQMSAVQALEQAVGFTPSPALLALRRLFYCGEWLESHALHIHLLAAPDFLRYPSAIAMAQDHPEVVRRGLRLQQIGNTILQQLGGRSVHPVGAAIGGFWRPPDAAEAAALLAQCEQRLADAEALVAWVAALPLPNDPQHFTSVALRHDHDYPMEAGRIISDGGLDIDRCDFQRHFQEFQQPHSTALHCHLEGAPYLVGPLARLNLNLDRLPAPVQHALAATGIRFPSQNMFHSALARALEIQLALLEAIRLLRGYQPERCARQPVTPTAGVGYGCTEAPRGILWHRFEIDGEGRVVSATIVPPTSQNQARIEQDLRTALQRGGLDRSEEALRNHGEMVIRNYDPCISCATHFLRLRIDRQ